MGSLVWNCYKASCNVKGGTRVHLSIDDIRDGFAGAEKYAEDFVMPEYVVPFKGQRELTRFTAEYGIDEWELFYDVKDNRAVFPVRHDGVIVDATGRSLSKRLPKWKKYGKSGLPFTAGWVVKWLFVEDCVSATVVGYSSFVGVALLGTSLQESHKGSFAVLDSGYCIRPRCIAKDFADGKGTTWTCTRCACLKTKQRFEIS